MGIEIDGLGRLERKLERVKAEIRAGTRELIDETSASIEARARQNVRKKSGATADSIRREIDEDGRDAKIGTNYFVGNILEHGSKAHTIRPKSKQALDLTGGDHPVAVTQHPGTPAFPWLFPAAEAERPQFRERSKRIWRQAIRRAVRS